MTAHLPPGPMRDLAERAAWAFYGATISGDTIEDRVLKIADELEPWLEKATRPLSAEVQKWATETARAQARAVTLSQALRTALTGDVNLDPAKAVVRMSREQWRAMMDLTELRCPRCSGPWSAHSHVVTRETDRDGREVFQFPDCPTVEVPR